VAEAPSEGSSETSMRSRMAWAIFVLVVVLIVIALMRFNLTALHEPGRAETRLANLSKRYFIYRASRHGIPPRPQDTKASIERGGSHYGLDCGVCHAEDGRDDCQGSGCTHAHLISRASRCRATPTGSCFGLSRMESASLECRLSVTSRPQIMFGISSTMCGLCRAIHKKGIQRSNESLV
jgi:hypothetical protein